LARKTRGKQKVKNQMIGGLVLLVSSTGCSAGTEAPLTEVGEQQQAVVSTPVRIAKYGASGAVSSGAAATSASLRYYGGPVISNVKMVVVNWTNRVNSTVSTAMTPFFSAVSDGPQMDWLTEYNTLGVTPVDGGASSNQIIGRGSVVGSFTITPQSTATTISEITIRDELNRQFSSGGLPSPTGNSLYVVYTPPGVKIATTSSGNSCVSGGFCGIHFAYNLNNQTVPFAVIPDFGTGSGCDSGCGSGTQLENVMKVSSHEMIEAITDANVSGGTVSRPLAWYDSANGEIADICGSGRAAVGSYTLQTEWSNLAGACRSTNERVSALNGSGSLYVKEAALGSPWVNEIGGIKAYATTPTRIGALTTGGSLFVKEGGLSASWVAVRDQVAAFDLSGSRIAALGTDGVLYVNEGGLKTPFVAEIGGVKAFSLSGARIGALSNDGSLRVKEGSLSASWALEWNTGAQGFALANDRIAVLSGGSLLVKEGGLSQPWLNEIGSVAAFALAGSRIGALTTDGVLRVKEGNLSSTWVVEIGSVKAFALAGDRIGALTTDGVLRVKEGGLSGTWVPEIGGVGSFDLSATRIAALTTAAQLYVKDGPLSALWVNDISGIQSTSLGEPNRTRF
jgi:hypothetical protein